MIMKGIGLCLGICFCCNGMMKGQEAPTGASAKGEPAVKTVPGFWQNWYLEAGGGVQMLLTDRKSDYSFGDKLTTLYSLGVGKWFSPAWGIRLRARGAELNGFRPAGLGQPNDAFEAVRNDVTVQKDGSHRYYLRYANLAGDIRMSLAGLIGKDEVQRWDLQPGLGIGWLHTIAYRGTPVRNLYTVNYSLMLKYALSRRWDINLEADGMLTDNYLNTRPGKNYQNVLGLNLGVTWHLGKRGFPAKRVYIPQDVARVYRDTLYVIYKEGSKKAVEQEVKTPLKVFTLTSIRFDLNKDHPIQGEDIRLVEVARYLKLYPNTHIRLEGYADKTTGSETYNYDLSLRRARAVQQILMKEYGIGPERIEVEGLGGSKEVYEGKGIWNCVVLVNIIQY